MENPSPVQGPEPEWKSLINQLANLNNRGDDIKIITSDAAKTIQNQSQALETVSDALEQILNNIKKNPSTIEIKEALEKANGNQVKAIDSLINDQNETLKMQLNTLEAKVKQVSGKTSAITNAQNPPSSQTTSGGKRRRRTRNKKRKYNKKTKRGGYKYGNRKEKIEKKK
jgi:hypothetical protein